MRRPPRPHETRTRYPGHHRYFYLSNSTRFPSYIRAVPVIITSFDDYISFENLKPNLCRTPTAVQMIIRLVKTRSDVFQSAIAPILSTTVSIISLWPSLTVRDGNLKIGIIQLTLENWNKYSQSIFFKIEKVVTWQISQFHFFTQRNVRGRPGIIVPDGLKTAWPPSSLFTQWTAQG